MFRARTLLIGASLLLPLFAGAVGLPCDDDNHPQICAFLNRYISELHQWHNPDITLYRKLRDDKFIILNGTLDGVRRCNDSTEFSIKRYDNKSYEVMWNNGHDTLLHVAFPIQYELILGMPQNEIEQHMQEYVTSAPQRVKQSVAGVRVDCIAPNIFRSTPKQHYQIPAINNCRYFYKNDADELCLITDAAQMEYTIANIFQDGLDKKYLMQVEQSVYGFKHIDYTISLQQWLNYCESERLTCYVAIEEVMEEAVMVLVVAENVDLAYNHLLSVLIPRNSLEKTTGTMLVKLNAFIPTHNITDLYEQYTTKPKNQREWIKD